MGGLPTIKRIEIFTKTLAVIDAYFAHQKGIGKTTADTLYKKYFNKVLGCRSRHEFYLIMCGMLAELKNGHTWYHDSVFEKEKLGFTAFYHDRLERWIVMRGDVAGIHIGDSIESVDGTPICAFFAAKRRYICGSNERYKRNRLFNMPALFPNRFYVGMEGSSRIVVRKSANQMASPEHAVSYKELGEGIGYIRIGSFSHYKTHLEEKMAVSAVRELSDDRSLIIDVRGNNGGMTPIALMRALMPKSWKDNFGEYVKPLTAQEKMMMVAGVSKIKLRHGKRFVADPQRIYYPFKWHYQGKLIILADQGTVSAAEDFVMPFKAANAATIIGSTTAGTTGSASHLDFGDISVGIGSVRCSMPDGARFEGVGIKPDITAYPNPDDMKHGIDTVLDKAITLAKA